MRSDLFIKPFIAIFSIFIISCGGIIKDISFETGDYLETGYEEKTTISKTKKGKESQNDVKQIQGWIENKQVTKYEEEKRIKKNSLLASIIKAIPEPSDEEEMFDIYEKAAKLSYEELDKLLRTELENNNFKIVHVLNITNPTEGRETTELWRNIHIYLVYKSPQCAKIIRHNPQLVSQFPFKIYTYEKDEQIIVGTFKPSTAIKYMGNLDAEGIRALKEIDLELTEIIDKITKIKKISK